MPQRGARGRCRTGEQDERVVGQATGRDGRLDVADQPVQLGKRVTEATTGRLAAKGTACVLQVWLVDERRVHTATSGGGPQDKLHCVAKAVVVGAE